MSLEDTIRVLVLSEGLERILKVRALRLVNTREKAITDEMVEERIKELKPHHPVFAAILEKVHEMNLKEVVNALVVIEGLRWLLKIHAPGLRLHRDSDEMIGTHLCTLQSVIQPMAA